MVSYCRPVHPPNHPTHTHTHTHTPAAVLKVTEALVAGRERAGCVGTSRPEAVWMSDGICPPSLWTVEKQKYLKEMPCQHAVGV